VRQLVSVARHYRNTDVKSSDFRAGDRGPTATRLPAAAALGSVAARDGRIYSPGSRMGLLALVLLAVAGSGPPGALLEETLMLEAPSEVVATVTAGCAGCSWGAAGREAAVLVLDLDGRYSQHLVLTRGERPVEYPVFLGALAAGPHRLRVRADRQASARGAGAVTVPAVAFRRYAVGDPDYEAQAWAPFVHARPGTLRRFSDLPLFSWCETDVTARGRRLRYSIVFSNEDGGTPVDRLMATWGRTTDVEFVYAVDLDETGGVTSETYQAKGHALVPFTGRHAGRHPLLWVVTDNNMVGPKGRASVRFAPAPRPADLAHRSREAVMGDEPWSYRVSSEELRREGKVAEGATPGSKRIPDPRRFVFLEACAPVVDATLAFAVAVEADGGLAWRSSDEGGERFRVWREPHNFPNGCFQSALALPAGVGGEAIRAIRLQAHTRPPGKHEAPLPPGTGRARLVSVSRLFMLDANDEPGKSLLTWTGDAPLVGEGPGFEIPVRPHE
jgi:hypothetical protein